MVFLLEHGLVIAGPNKGSVAAKVWPLFAEPVEETARENGDDVADQRGRNLGRYQLGLALAQNLRVRDRKRKNAFADANAARSDETASLRSRESD